MEAGGKLEMCNGSQHFERTVEATHNQYSKGASTMQKSSEVQRC